MTIASLSPSSTTTPAFRELVGTDSDDGSPQYQNHYIFDINTLSWREVDGSTVVATPDPDRTYIEAEVELSLTQFGRDVDARNDNQVVEYVASRFDVYPTNFDRTNATTLQNEVDAILLGQFDQLDHIQVQGTIEQWIEARADGTGTLYLRFYASFVTDPPGWKQPGIRVRFGGMSSHWALDASFGVSTAAIEDVEFDPAGGWFAVGGRDSAIHIHEYGGTWGHLQTLTMGGMVTGMGVNSDGSLLASVDRTPSCVIHNTADWSTAQTFTDSETDYPRAVEFSPDDTLLAYPENSPGVQIRNTSDWSIVTTLTEPTAAVRGVAWSQNYLAVGSKDFNTYVYDRTWTLQQTITVATDWIEAVDFSDDESYLAIAGYDNNVHIVNTSDWTLNHSITNASSVMDTEFLSDQFVGYASAGGTNETHTYDAAAGWPHDNTFSEPVSRSYVSKFSQDGAYFAAADYGSPYQVHIYDTPVTATTVTGPAVTLDGTVVQGAEIAAIDNATGEVLGEAVTDVNGDWSIEVPAGTTVHVLAEYEDANGNLYQEHSKPFVATT